MSGLQPTPDKLARLDQRMAEFGVNETDLEETFVRSGGAGGQKVNKSSSCVMLHHRPTGLRVKCQATRYQGMNRFLARRLLLDKLKELKRGRREAERGRLEKIRRQQRQRSRRAKDRMLAEKSRHGEKKRQRRNLDF
jgi:protein subunit release factor B